MVVLREQGLGLHARSLHRAEDTSRDRICTPLRRWAEDDHTGRRGSPFVSLSVISVLRAQFVQEACIHPVHVTGKAEEQVLAIM